MRRRRRHREERTEGVDIFTAKEGQIKKVSIWTDGSCMKNPGGPGGWACVIREDGCEATEIHGWERSTTNNRMEILAAIRGLEALDKMYPAGNVVVTVYSDSRYLVDAVMAGWLKAWRRRGYGEGPDGRGKGRKNADLWKQVWELLQGYRVKFKWVKGHANQPENVRSDRLAYLAAKYAEERKYEDDVVECKSPDLWFRLEVDEVYL
jgi:ribonuclease HI